MMYKEKTLTIEDIARVAGVSIATVSRVINGTAVVAPEKRQAVLTAIDHLGYRPNLTAQSLARGRSLIVGVLTQDLASPFYGGVVKGVQRGLHGTGYNFVLASGNQNLEEERKGLELLIDRQIDGLLVVGSGLPDEHLRRIARRLPLVVIGRSVSGLEDQCVCVENMQGARAATRYLIGLGHRRIALVTGRADYRDSIDRRDGYSRALQEAGIEVDPRLIVEGNFTEQSGLAAMDKLLVQGAVFTAILVANDQMAYGVRLGLFRRGLRVPEDISLVGFDDQGVSAYMLPPLTTVRQPMLDMGSVAAQALLRLIDGKRSGVAPFPTELVVRESASPLTSSVTRGQAPRPAAGDREQGPAEGIRR